MELREEFVTLDIAIALKEIGFDEPCLAFFDGQGTLCLGNKPEYLISNEKANYIFGNDKSVVVLAPLLHQVFRWFRNEQKIFGEVFIDDDGTFGSYISRLVEGGGISMSPIKRQFLDYEYAETRCIIDMIKIIKEQKENKL